MVNQEMIVAVAPNFHFLMVNPVNVIPNQIISVARNGATVVVMQSIVIAQLVSITNFWANDGMQRFYIHWNFHYLV